MLRIFAVSLAILAIINDVSPSKYVYRQGISGWLRVNKEVATWNEAYTQCFYDGGVLVSPINEDMRTEMTSLTALNNTLYFTGISTIFYPGPKFVSLENVLLEDMPVMDTVARVDSSDGECIAMDSHGIHTVSCTMRLPYLCYKKHLVDMSTLKCGTSDQEYIYASETGSCYKLHKETKTWDEAYVTCQTEGAYLVVMNSMQEIQVVSNLLSWSDFWIFTGLRQWHGTGDWMSVRGEHLKQLHNFWAKDHEQTTHLRPNYKCANIYPDGRLWDDDCNLKYYFICEKDPKYIQYHYEEK